VIGFVLAAGFGTRLRPLTDHIPKALVPVCGRPLLGRSIDFFRCHGIERIAVNTHHYPDRIKKFLDSQGLQCTLFHETGRIRGTGGALHFARGFLGTDDVFCVANVDIIAAVDLGALRQAFLKLDCEAGLVGMPSDRGTVWYRKRDREYVGARSEDAASAQHAGDDTLEAEFLGIAFYRKQMLNVLKKADFSVLPVWKRMQKTGMSVKIVETGRVYWNDLGTPGKLAQVHFDVIDGTCGIDIPEDIVLDPAGKRAYPRSWKPEAAATLGPYSWVEADAVPLSSSLSRVVVFRDAAVPDNASLRNAIVTPYGVIPFEA
jgi:NDP-sugar pyrophosphorylase family protein